MNLRTTTTLAAVLLLSISGTAALAQPAPAPTAPPPDTTAPPATTATPDAPPPSDTTTPRPDAPPPSDTATPPPETPPSSPPETPPAPPQEAAPQPPAAPPADPEPAPDGNEDLPRPFVARAAGFSVWPIALIQAQATPYIGQNASFLSGDIAERAGFRIRRTRLGIGAQYKSLLRAELQAEMLTNAQVSLLLNQAWVGVTPKPWFGVSMGMLDVPFSRSLMSPSADQALIDRALAVRAIAPQQQLGLLAHGLVAEGRFQYYLGVYNGFQRFDQFYSGYRQPQAGYGNRFDNLAYAARIATALDTPGEEIPGTGDRRNRINIGASYFYSDGGARDIHGIGADLLFMRSGFRFMGDFMYSTVIPDSVPSQPITQTTDITSMGIVAEAGYTFRKMVGGHLRFEWIDPNMAVQDNSDNWLLTVGLSFNPPVIGKYCKAQLEYTHREELYGLSLDNDAVTIQTQFMLQ